MGAHQHVQGPIPFVTEVLAQYAPILKEVMQVLWQTRTQDALLPFLSVLQENVNALELQPMQMPMGTVLTKDLVLVIYINVNSVEHVEVPVSLTTYYTLF